MAERVFLEHELIKKDSVEARSYQIKIAKNCLQASTLVCLPTGLGKTVVAVLVAAERLKRHPDKKVVMLAPTRPLVLQHLITFRRVLTLPPDDVEAVTGFVPPQDRVETWKKRLIFSTPQVFMNDILASRVNLDEISLMILDEAHRAVGDYAYTFIAERYAAASTPLILGLTASPGCSRQDIETTMRNLHIANVEARTVMSTDVKPYVSGIDVEWVKVALPEEFSQVKRLLNSFLDGELLKLNGLGLLQGVTHWTIKLRSLLEMLELLKRRDLELPPEKRREAAIRAYSTIHALKVLELLETQGPDAVHTYVKNLRERMAQRRTASAAEFLENQNVTRALQLVDQIIAQRIDHPKIPKLTELVERSLREGARRIMIFTNYRSTAARLVETLNDLGGPIAAIRLVGQASKTDDKGLSQKEQTLILDDFKTGAYNVLIATQVGEEGLDIVECDHVIFYDTVSSAIRYIQRRGRTGRRGPGRVTVLAAAGTRDEAYYWIARRREKDMAEVLNRITKDEEKVQPSLDEFVKRSPLPREGEARVKIVADVREAPSQVLRQLSRYQVTLEMRSLLYGDFILSDRVAVERKSSDDLATSIIDGRLFEQAANLKSQYERPILLIEGETLASSRNMNPASIMGAVASLLVDYQLPVVWTTDPAETALLLYSIARREQTESAREPRIRSEKRITSPTWLQEFIVAGLPHVDVTLAKRLLQRFKTVEGIFTASTRELQEVEGIGDKKSKRIREILTREYTPE